MKIIFPKCGIDGCGSRTFRLVGIIKQSAAKGTKISDIFVYQCSHGHVIFTGSEIKDVVNPLVTVSQNEASH